MPRISLKELTAAFAPTLGEERSNELLSETVRALRIAQDPLEDDQAIALFEHLSRTPGVVGIAARLAHRRFQRERIEGSATQDAIEARAALSSARRALQPVVTESRRIVVGPPSSRHERHEKTAEEPSSDRRIEPSSLAALLAPTVGEEKAQELVARGMADAGVTQLTRDTALALLEKLASDSGIVGVAARFAKVRFLLAK